MNEIIPVMVNGLPGKMANAIAWRIAKSEDFEVFSHSYTGPEINRDYHNVDEQEVTLVHPQERAEFLRRVTIPENLMVVDFTHPSALNDNVNHYCENGWNFVAGTTGGDRKALEERLRSSGIAAVVAPNMAKQVVALQGFMEFFANSHLGSLGGRELVIVESHQQGKADTSGTAKAMVGYFNKLGIEFKPEQIEMIRDPAKQIKLGIPEPHLKGHGWHSYMVIGDRGDPELMDMYQGLHNFLNWAPAFEGYSRTPPLGGNPGIDRRSPDGNVMLSVEFAKDEETTDAKSLVKLMHNVNGRSVYVDGTMDALRFLKGRVDSGEKGRAYSMVDVLKTA